MANTDEEHTMMHLVAALHAHIVREEEERRRDPEAWLAMLTVTTQQQWALLECIRTERERRVAQAHTVPRGQLETCDGGARTRPRSACVS
jgi:hypothetical protein